MRTKGEDLDGVLGVDFFAPQLTPLHYLQSTPLHIPHIAFYIITQTLTTKEVDSRYTISNIEKIINNSMKTIMTMFNNTTDMSIELNIATSFINSLKFVMINSYNDNIKNIIKDELQKIINEN